MENVEIGYKLKGLFEIPGTNECIRFEILFPQIYESIKEVKECHGLVSAKMEQCKNEVIIRLYENGRAEEVIHWDEWKKYKCIHVKKTKQGAAHIDENMDYEPYTASFEEIFKNYRATQNRTVCPMRYLKYGVVPIIIRG